MTVLPANHAAFVLLDPHDRAALGLDVLTVPGFEKTIVRELDFEHLAHRLDAIADEAHAEGVTFTLYSRNDQVFRRRSIGPMIRRLQTGYSTFSGIDDGEAHAQARQALNDLESGVARLPLPPIEPARYLSPAHPAGTVSLVFDTEQICGVRFGLPRILSLLDQYGVRATFFVTGFVQNLYPDLVPALVERGHEVGIHGAYHECMAGLPPGEQTCRICDHLDAFRQYTDVVGANFIFRMDACTLRTLAAAGIRYCVTFALHYYYPFAYTRPATQPLPVHTRDGSLWLVPVPVETYGRPWFSTRRLIDSALLKSQQEGTTHVTVLMHPFRDGSRRNLPQLNKLLDYVIHTQRLTPVTLANALPIAPWQPVQTRLWASLERIDHNYREHGPRTNWARSELYFDRLNTVYHALVALGRDPALVFEDGDPDTTVAIYPEIPSKANIIPFDPLDAATRSGPAWHTLLRCLNHAGTGQLAFGPSTMTAIQPGKLQRPRVWQDIAGLLPEVALRAAYRLNPGRVVF